MVGINALDIFPSLLKTVFPYSLLFFMPSLPKLFTQAKLIV
jgi:hypothetical protein